MACVLEQLAGVSLASALKDGKKLFTLLDLCVSSLRRGHANLLCIVPILTDDPRRESKCSKAVNSLHTERGVGKPFCLHPSRFNDLGAFVESAALSNVMEFCLTW